MVCFNKDDAGSGNLEKDYIGVSETDLVHSREDEVELNLH